MLQVENLPANYYSKVEKKISAFNDKLTKKSEKYLQKLAHKERTIQQKLQKFNPAITDMVFTSTNEKYDELVSSIKSKTAKASKIVGGQYNSYLDTLRTSLSFLKQFTNISDKVKSPLSSLEQLQSKIQQSEKIKEFIAVRKQKIKELLSKYTHVPAGLKKQYDNYSKQVYYYSAQVKEYKDMVKDPEKVERKALNILNTLPAFQKFMKENSQLASLFGFPGNSNNSTQSLAGLQTRSSINELIQQRISSGGPNALQQVQQNMSQAHREMDKLKSAINKIGGGNSDTDIPDFKPNTQKTKSFLKRLEYGTNVQFEKSNKFLPSIADIALSVGYKLNDKSIIGIGASFKLGMGTIQHINLTGQGISFRNFIDYKIKQQLFLSGGYELNHNTSFKNISQLKDINSWQQSGLLGLSRKYKITNKVKGNLQLLYDLLYKEHIPTSNALVFRLGYLF